MEYSWHILLKRLYEDLSDRLERQYYGFWLISQIPCAFGNMLRARYCSRRFKKVGREITVLAGTRFRSMENLVVGDKVTIGNDNFIQARGGVKIGNNVLLGPGVKIWSTNHNYKFMNIPICEQGLENSPVIIGNDIWLSSNVFILPGTIIPDGVVVAAGAVVTNKKYVPYSILAGNPAQMVGMRNKVADASMKLGCTVLDENLAEHSGVFM